MSEVLSQSEIDALLSALSTGELDVEEIKTEEKSKKVKIYDFKRPDKFSKDQIRTLQMLHDSFARLLTTSLSAQLRTMVQIQVVSVEQLTYDEFVRSIPTLTTLTIFDMEPLEGSGILELGPNVTFPIIDRLLGGPGYAPERSRELTDIEEIIIGKILNRMLDYLQESWKNVVAFNPSLKSIETNPQFVQIVPPNDMVVLITLNAMIGRNDGIMTICLPYIVLEPILSKLSAHYWFASTRKETTVENLSLIKKKIEKAKVPIVVELGGAVIPIQELLQLQVGDVLPLDAPLNKEMEVKIGTRIKYKARPGLAGNRVAVQITSIVEEGEDENNGY